MNAQRELINVPLGERSYAIHVGEEILDEFGDALAVVAHGRQVGLVSDDVVGPLYGARLAIGLERAGFAVSSVRMPNGEEHKTLATAARLIDAFVDARLDRNATIVALGGGVVGDVAGFAASIYLRGVRFAQIPTTVVAQVDASVGGKTGVDHPRGKNLIGAFHQPSLVFIDVATLGSLPRRELRAGLAEVVKHAIIRDPVLFRHLEDELPRLAGFDAPLGDWVRLVAANCRIKADVVVADEREEGLREILNYGHTAGHAIESLGHYERYRHGEAVLLGMRIAGALARLRGIWSARDARRQDALLDVLATADFPTDLAVAAVWDAMLSDKKARAGKIRFVLPRRIGDVGIVSDVTLEEFERAWVAAIVGEKTPAERVR